MFATSLRALGALVVLSAGFLSACGGDLPNTAGSDVGAERRFTGGTAAIPIVELVRERGIETPDQASPVPLLEQVRRQLARSDPQSRWAGITYDLTGGNRLPRDWLIQSPNRWSHSGADLPYYPLACKDCEPDLLLPTCESDADCPNGGTCQAVWPRPLAAMLAGRGAAARKVCFGHSDALLLPVHALVLKARRFVDIGVLQPVPDARFLGTVRAALDELAVRGRAVQVRLLVGQYPPAGSDAAALLAALVGDLEHEPRGRLSISVAALRTCTTLEACNSFSWPHAKFIAVDGEEALVGGHNQWSEDYLVDAPVHDLSMRVDGPAAMSATRFADRLWQFVCGHRAEAPAVQLASFPRPAAGVAGPCPDHLAEPPGPRPAAGVPILAVGRMGAGIATDFANHSELARDLVLGSARRTIYLAQQDLGFTLGRAAPIYPESTLERLVDFVVQRQGELYIVLSNFGAVGNSGSSYSNSVSLATLAAHLREVAQRRAGRDVDDLLCRHVHLAPFRFGPDATWPGNRPIANHAKLWMVDERVFYLGSDNAYPVNLQEFGYVVDDRAAARELVARYWKPLWQWARLAAVSGESVEPCVFAPVR
ncbi:MAG: hypothetical protein U1E23_08215 [Reyranellaceae bacterium]